MAIVIVSAAFLVAAAFAVVMGYAVQRGATCMVAAVDEVVSHRRVTRVLALGEAALWVTGGLFVAIHLGLLTQAPQGFAFSVWPILGGALLGAGALVNRACVFGTIARFGSGEWAYALTPIGFFLGCLTAAPVLMGIHSTPLTTPSLLYQLPRWVAVLIVPVLSWRAYEAVVAARARKFGAHVWAPHQATTVIGIAFVVMMLTVGGWAYTELLSEWATNGMALNSLPRALLFVALLSGAVAGGWTSRKIRWKLPTAGAAVRCLAGGWLMGLGSLLTPGGNDGLVLVGIPLLLPHAWSAIAAMIVTIAIGLMLQRRSRTPLVATAR